MKPIIRIDIEHLLTLLGKVHCAAVLQFDWIGLFYQTIEYVVFLYVGKLLNPNQWNCKVKKKPR